MIKKQDIIDTMVEEGLTIIESDRIVNSKKEFQEALQGLMEEKISDLPIEKLSLRQVEIILVNWTRNLDCEKNIFGVPQFQFGEKQLRELIKIFEEKLKNG